MQDLVSAMDAEKTNDEMKKNLMTALNKKVQLKGLFISTNNQHGFNLIQLPV